jgi:uncharacterized membrane protein YdbT with pleckstrin-like domain
VTGQVPITNALRKAPGVEVTDRESVYYLREKLNWAVTSVGVSALPPCVVVVVVVVIVAAAAASALFYLAFSMLQSFPLPPSG